jgi:hypothetical protein
MLLPTSPHRRRTATQSPRVTSPHRDFVPIRSRPYGLCTSASVNLWRRGGVMIVTRSFIIVAMRSRFVFPCFGFFLSCLELLPAPKEPSLALFLVVSFCHFCVWPPAPLFPPSAASVCVVPYEFLLIFWDPPSDDDGGAVFLDAG